MIICAAHNLSKMYGGEWVFQGIHLEVQDGDRVAIVGRNGSGKTTLLRLLARVDSPDDGQVSIRATATVGYLTQVPSHSNEMTVRQVLEKSFSSISGLATQMREIEDALASARAQTQYQSMLDEYAKLQAEFEQQDGYSVEAKLSRVIRGLSIPDVLLEMPFVALSGGEQTKVGLAALLLQEPDVLLLDEPTNHLDLHAIEWLEAFLGKYKGAVVMVSHDRYFLDHVANKIFDLEDGELVAYVGNYSSFALQKEARLLTEFQAYQDQHKKIEKMKETIKRLHEWANQASPPNAGLHRRANSMQKALDKVIRLKRPILERKKIGLAFEMEERSGKDVIQLEQLGMSFGERDLFREIDLLVRFQEHVALVGVNGAGKSTLMKLILGHLAPDCGSVKLGAGTKVGYLSQKGLEGYARESVIDAFRDEVMVTEGQARHILARFLFYGAAVFRKVHDLSGGERMRLRLAQLMFQDINLLLLDEPTNHLDIESREVLEDALAKFDGTIFAISHDRYFINQLFERVCWLESGSLMTYLGNYDDARRKRLI